MNKIKMTVGRKLLTMLLVLSLACGCICLQTPKKASAKAVSKVTKVVTINKKNPQMYHVLNVKKDEKIVVKIKFLSIKGKKNIFAKEGLWYGEYISHWGKGSFHFTPNTYQKGKVVKTKPQRVDGYLETEWGLYRGMEDLKIQVTYETKSGRKGIESFKESREYIGKY